MAWTAPRTWAVNEYVDDAMLNEQIKDNETYLKTQLDLLHVITQTDETAIRALGSVYQNTSGKIKVVTVTVTGSEAATGTWALTGTANPPGIVVSRVLQGTGYRAMTFAVPVDYYYRAQGVSGTGTAIVAWVDWTLH